MSGPSDIGVLFGYPTRNGDSHARTVHSAERTGNLESVGVVSRLDGDARRKALKSVSN